MIYLITNYKRGIDDNFVLNYIPKTIAIRMFEVCDKKDTSRMDDYLTKMYGITTKDVIKDVASHIDTNWYGDLCEIGIDTNAYNIKSNQRIESLMKLVDNGNSDVKGLGIFRESLMFIKQYINLMYKSYLRKNDINKKEGR